MVFGQSMALACDHGVFLLLYFSFCYFFSALSLCKKRNRTESNRNKVFYLPYFFLTK